LLKKKTAGIGMLSSFKLVRLSWTKIVSTKIMSHRAAFFAFASRLKAKTRVGSPVLHDDGLFFSAQLLFDNEAGQTRCCALLRSATFFCPSDPTTTLECSDVIIDPSMVSIVTWDDYLPSESSPEKPEKPETPPPLPANDCDPLPVFPVSPLSEFHIGSEPSLDLHSPLCKFQAIDVTKELFHLVRCHLHSTGGRDRCSPEQDRNDNNYVAASSSFHAAFDGFSVDMAAPLIMCRFAADPWKRRHETGRFRVFFGFTGRNPPLFRLQDMLFQIAPTNCCTIGNVHFIAIFVTDPKSFEINMQWKATDTKRIWKEKLRMTPVQLKEIDRTLDNAVVLLSHQYSQPATPAKGRLVRSLR
jgi:hypothetical protein